MICTVPNDRCVNIFGKSTDRKPKNKHIGNGSQFIEQDTGKIFFYDEEHKEWLEFRRNGEAE